MEYPQRRLQKSRQEAMLARGLPGNVSGLGKEKRE